MSTKPDLPPPFPPPASPASPASPTRRVVKPDDDWLRELTLAQYRITRRKGTEPPFSGAYWNATRPGVYRCVCCDHPLFDAADKFDAGTGWPSFTHPASAASVATCEDRSFFMRRTEVLCACCDAHLGHLYDDGPAPGRARYCVNSTALRLDERAA